MSEEDIFREKEFHRNMRRTPWHKLFPHWWAENDELTNAIGAEVERIKALAIFSLLNAGIKPPVMTWKDSIVHKEYHVKSHLDILSSFVTIQAPLYKTWGKITLTNNTKDEIENLKIMVTEDDGLLINQVINREDTIVFDLETQKTTLNGTTIQTNNIGEGIPYFKTVQNNLEYDEDTPLHNAVVRLEFASNENTECDIDVDIQMDNVVFTDEYNIEVTGLELVPIDRIDVYALYDFEFNPDYNGWHHVYSKKYEKQTNVLYDMIAIQLYTEQYYVEVYFKGLEYPYKVGFPCYKDAEKDSMYHVNNRLDSWGEQLGLERRNYKTDIAEKDYATTFPIYYPYDIEQDYWYYKRLTNEYNWNDLAINDVDLKDTSGNNIIRLHSINPFTEDFVVHAKSSYPSDKYYHKYETYIPSVVSEQNSGRNNQQVHYSTIKNLLKYDDNQSSVTLQAKTGPNINDWTYQSKELWTYFNLIDLPEDINIDNIEILIEGNSTDNKIDKYSNSKTGLIIPNLYEDDITFIPLTADTNYEFSEKVITYSSNQLQKYLKDLQDHTDEYVQHEAIIGEFEVAIGHEVHIPFTCYENGEEINDITDVWVYFDDTVVSGQYANGYINVIVPQVTKGTNVTFIVKSLTHKPLTVSIDIGKGNKKIYELDEDGKYVYQTVDKKDENGNVIYEWVEKKDEDGNVILDENGEPVKEKVKATEEVKKLKETYNYIYGPLVDNRLQRISVTEDWHTKDVRNILQKQGIYFRNIFENENEQSQTSINIKNILLKISYSQKKSTFNIETNINRNVQAPKIGQYEITIKNTGDKALHTNIDIINAPNIRLSQNYIKVDLDAYEEMPTQYIDIYPEYPIDDGYYDILTVCEDYVKKDVIGIFTTGLIETGIKLNTQHGKYTEPITVTAEIVTADGELVTDTSNIEFYINNYYVKGRNDDGISIDNNIVTMTFDPQDYKFINTGLQTLTVKFGGNNKYSGSSASNDIFIRKENSLIEIEVDENVEFQGSMTLKASVFYLDSNGEKQPVDDGTVTFYADEIMLAQITEDKETVLASLNNTHETGVFNTTIDVPLEPGDYTLWVRYSNSTQYASDEASQPLKVVGGETNINVFDIQASPIDEITFRANITDSMLEPIPLGTAHLLVQYENGTNIIDIDEDVPINNGIIEYDYKLNFNLTNNESVKVDIVVSINQEKGFVGNVGKGRLTISKKDVIVDVLDTYNFTQYEPLGFLVRVLDANTNKPIESGGKVEVSIPRQSNIVGYAKVDEDGYARIICNPMVSIEEWDTTGYFYFDVGKDIDTDATITRNGQQVHIQDLLGTEVEDKDLYFMYVNDDLDDTQPKFFKLEDDKLIYIDEERNVEELHDDFFFIENHHLYRQTSTQIRNYITGTYNARFKFSDNPEYKNRERVLEDGITINQTDIDLDLHQYDLRYKDTHDIICYVSEYDRGVVSDGSVKFFIDEEEFYTSGIEDSKAIIPYTELREIKNGKHLIKAYYPINNATGTYTYAILEMRKNDAHMNVNVSSVVKGEQITVIVTFDNLTGVLSGFVNVYIDNQLITYEYLYGNEGYYGIVNQNSDDTSYTIADIIPENRDLQEGKIVFQIPAPEDEETHKLTIEYEGNEIYNEIIEERDYVLEQVEISDIAPLQKFVNYEEEAVTDFIVSNENNYIINEGYLVILQGDTIVGTSNTVNNNKATIRWQPEEDGQYTVKYMGSEIYVSKEIPLRIEITGTREEIVLPSDDYVSFENALQCLTRNGTIYIEDEYEFDKLTTINKPLNLIGEDGTIILKNDLIINSNVNIKDVTIKSETNNGLINKQSLTIVHSILEDSIFVEGNNNLTINRSLVYCPISAVRNANLDNNWWGQNESPYSVNNNIILSLHTEESPAVISDDIHIVGQLIGNNGNIYDIPEANFILTSDNGYFSVDNGKTVNHKIETTYFDATEEGDVYLTVDNQTVSTHIYDYNKKTETILEPITDIPLGYYITFNALVCSVTDNYDELSQMGGYVDFYIDNQHIGRSDVQNNKAQVSTYIKNIQDVYEAGDIKELKAIYRPNSNEDYFSSSDTLTFNIIDTEGIYYVSPESIYGNGKFDNPFGSIAQALDQPDCQKVFLKPGNYTEYNINTDKKVTIRGYNDDIVFKEIPNEENAYIFNGAQLSIERINFIDNQITLFDHIDTISESLLYNNTKISNNDINVQYCTIIGEDVSNTNTYTQCWFGTNDPSISNVTDYVQMNVTASKTDLYKGVVATIKADLLTLKSGEPFNTSKHMPLRIGIFSSEDASLQPLHDYTYNNYVTSLLNTNIASNSSKYYLKILNPQGYINQTNTIQCQVLDSLLMPVSNGTVNFAIPNIINSNEEINNGIAKTTINAIPQGEYDIVCTYENDGITKVQDTLVIKKHDIKMETFQMEVLNSRMIEINFEVSATDNESVNEPFDIFVDDEYVTTVDIVNNQLSNQIITYPIVQTGNHKLKITNKNDSYYDTFEYEEPFFTQKLDTQISFNYVDVTKGVENDFIISVLDSNNEQVRSGQISIAFDGETICDNQSLHYGTYVQPLKIDNKGEYPIFISYIDENGYYNNTTATFMINVDVFNVDIPTLPATISVDIGKKLLIKENVRDKASHLVSKGWFDIYIDDILIQERVYLSLGQLVYELEVPSRLSTGSHTLRLEYIDDSNTYLNTTITRNLIVNKIPTSIELDTFHAYPNQLVTIPFNVVSSYGKVNTGKIIFSIEDELNNTNEYVCAISDNLINQITFTMPNKIGLVTLNIEYKDDNGTYASSTLEKSIVMEKNNVIIDPKYKKYYPQKEFLYTMDITNQDGKRVSTGYVDIYVDNVKEYEHIKVINGQASTKMIFGYAKPYKIDIMYEDDEGYYEKTLHTYDIIIDSMDIDNIDIEIENKTITTLIFETLDNVNVVDGILYLYIDNIQMGVYNISESHKDIDLDISYLTKGEHTIAISYVSSLVFNDYRDEITITVDAKESTMSLNNVEIEVSDTLDITGSINTYGIVKFYFGNEHKYIGLLDVTEGDFTFDYKLPYGIEAGEYPINAEFMGNEYYDGQTASCIAVINKAEANIAFNEEEYITVYRNKVQIDCTTNVDRPNVNLYIEDTEGNIVDTKKHIILEDRPNEGDSVIEYTPKETMIGTYNIFLEYEGSAIYEPLPDLLMSTLIINPATPFIKDSSRTDFTTTIGGNILFSNDVLINHTDNDEGQLLNTGVIKYSINDEINFEFDVGQRELYTLPADYVPESTPIKIKAQYISEDESLILNGDEAEISVGIGKNTVNLQVNAPEYIDYGEEFEIEVIATSIIDVDTTITVNDIEATKIGNKYIVKYTINNQSELTTSVVSAENDKFLENSKNIAFKHNDLDIVKVNDDMSLANALEIVKDNGIIEIETSIDENVTIDKNVTINCNNNNISGEITNNANTIINDLNSTDISIVNNNHLEINNSTFSNISSDIIDNKDHMILNNCTFDSNTSTPITISNANAHTTINNCTFTLNNGSGNASCIYSNRVNELEISNTKFIQNNYDNDYGTSIYCYGDVALYHNIFYKNVNAYDVRIIKGNIVAEKNIFSDIEDTIPIQFEGTSTGDIDLNFWGENISDRDDINIDSSIEINNWLIGQVIESDNTVQPSITAYINTSEKEQTNINIEYDSFEVK